MPRLLLRTCRSGGVCLSLLCSALVARERGTAGEDSRVAQLLLDAQKLIVLRDALAASRRTSLDLTRVRRDHEVGDRGVLGLTRTVRQHGGVARALREADRIERLGERSDLVDLDEQRVGDAALDAVGETGRVRDEQVVADELDLRAESVGEELPVVPVVLSQRVLDRDDREVVDQALVVLDQLGAAPVLVVEAVDAVLEELGGCDVEAQRDVGARREAGLLDRLDEEVETLAVAGQIGCLLYTSPSPRDS